MRLGFVDRLRERLYAAAAHAEWCLLVRPRRSDLRHTLTRDVDRAGQGAMHVMQIAVGGAFVLAQGTLALLIAQGVAVAMALAGGVLLLAAHPLVRRLRTLGRRLTAGGQAVQAAAGEFLGGLKHVKSDGAEERHVREFNEAVAKIGRDRLAFTRSNAAAQAILGVGAAVALAALAWLAVATAGLGAPELLVTAVIAARVLPGLQRRQQEAQHLAHALPAWLQAMETERELLDAAEPRGGRETRPLFLRRELAVRDLSFGYRDGPTVRPVLLGIDLVVPAHAFVVITGASGAGKTTLADLLVGLMEPDAGKVRVDGVPLPGAGRRRSVAYVSQDPHLLHDTIRMNLLRGQPEVAETDLWRTLRQAAAEFVEVLPDGVETLVGDRGLRLSWGERQRIVLARALLLKPELLLLDEASSTPKRRTGCCQRSVRCADTPPSSRCPTGRR